MDPRDKPEGDECFEFLYWLLMRCGWVYILTNKPHGTLYVGMTSDLRARLRQHREGMVDGFTRRYGLHRLVYVEQHDLIVQAIQREKTIKHWVRAWKINAIEAMNPEWRDLTDEIHLL